MEHLRTNIEFDAFINTIFMRPPKSPQTIVITFDPNPEIDSTLFIFQRLVYIFTDGMKILFGINGVVDLSTLSIDDFALVKEYFNSFSIDIKYEIRKLITSELDTMFDIDKLPSLEQQNLVDTHAEYDSLKDHFFSITTKTHLYKIYFDYI